MDQKTKLSKGQADSRRTAQSDDTPSSEKVTKKPHSSHTGHCHYQDKFQDQATWEEDDIITNWKKESLSTKLQ
ncbi:hypothetical protein K493DRAFT_43131 [Basidiobolus meristosporus CBS 931.73]|uniref:Uncharacterized protein n=1 Tax=Basidiobolus meristosporus CBS 931.73 TaxID=1314790 RepID=A0A1Y1Y468_9FUNG|nr:hypothetical protein K493DRAFT_43131 [Basidiobolus meristosporus CBS 931.73]|eukprot:ORX92506.1 hypothetical protein K493DRAFT_43131 [Basidiobolus meristosporus CBS 931.73]